MSEPVTIGSQIQCVRREIALRKNVYAKKVEIGRMEPDAARAELDAMQAVERTLVAVQAAEPLAVGLLASIGYGVDVFADDESERMGFEGESLYAGPDDEDRQRAAEANRPSPRPQPGPAPLLDAAEDDDLELVEAEVVEPTSADTERDRAALRFETQAKTSDLTGDGYRALLAGRGVTSHADLSAKQLAEITAAISTPDQAADFNEAGFVERACGSVRSAPEKRCEREHEKQVEAAGERFGGERLARVRAALDRAAGLPIEPPATAYADGKAPKPALS